MIGAVTVDFLTKERLYKGWSNDRKFCVTDETGIQLLKERHKNRIALSDEIYVINRCGYIGQSTSDEIAFARSHGKKVTFIEK